MWSSYKLELQINLWNCGNSNKFEFYDQSLELWELLQVRITDQSLELWEL
ncbi:hypothetical protein LEP1GSC021_3061 [Leptospira noguchii str. 1993005606]|uniref:Uncharacterized protein n=1 Tax=Leptospira noguchii str. 2007001578 TaxID=1049974 RepID=A0ABP2T7D8_9LEPT|nr:hypothetical protein LEP1GSC035_4836 [Leptospira noguchii str. 2007001578]EPE85904.1 hypothetical protein LEP1GSC021_3061 [Leptospira noguchii str. 1993005606]